MSSLTSFRSAGGEALQGHSKVLAILHRGAKRAILTRVLTSMLSMQFTVSDVAMSVAIRPSKSSGKVTTSFLPWGSCTHVYHEDPAHMFIMSILHTCLPWESAQTMSILHTCLPRGFAHMFTMSILHLCLPWGSCTHVNHEHPAHMLTMRILHTCLPWGSCEHVYHEDPAHTSCLPCRSCNAKYAFCLCSSEEKKDHCLFGIFKGTGSSDRIQIFAQK
jgi:hypothetical protein